MKTSLVAASMAVATVTFSSGAAAQVSGIATANPTLAIARTKAFSAAYSAIGTQYKSYFDQVATRNQTLNSLRAQLDTNNDKQLTQAEIDTAVRAKNPVLQSIETEEREIQRLQAPAIKAQMFAVEKIFSEYGNAQQQVVANKKISVILNPDAFQYAPDSANVTADITAALDARVPTVSTTPPADWNPQRNTVALHQQLQQLIAVSAANQARQQQAQQQPAAAQPQGR